MKAYTVSELTSDGWEEVTSLPTISSELGKYYYVFWETQADLMLGEENGSGKGGDSQENQLTGVYKTPADPATDKTKVWILEYNATNFYGIRNLSNPQLLLQSRENATYRVQAAWERIQSIWTQWGLTYEDSKWSIQNKLPSNKGGGDNNWIGPWNKDAFQDNMVVAGNAGGNGNKKGLFKIYRKSRLSYEGISYDYASATAAAPLNVTALITNANFDHSTAGWNVTGEKPNAFNTDYKAFEAYHRVAGVNQDIQGIPNGKYAVSVQVACRDDNGTKVSDNLPKLIATSAYHTVSVVSNESPKDNFANTAKAMNDDASYAKISVNVNVTDGNLNVALNENNNNTWPVYDNFTLFYYGPTVAGRAVVLPDGGAMTAGQWYYIDIPAAAEYNATATTLTDIVYTTDGETLIENEGGVTDQFAAKDNALSKARYYVKSSSANSLEIAVAEDTYTLNESTKTFSITEGQYLQSISTFVVTYPDAETTSSDELVLIGTPKATLLKGSTPVAEGSLTGNNSEKSLTATFEEVELDQASTYTIQIAAGVFGYAGKAVNEAVSVSFNTGVIANGVYYFKRNGTETYLTRGGNYGTENVTDKFGISFDATLQTDGTYTLKNVDQSLVDNTAKYLNEQYTDQGSYKWTIEATNGGYLLKRANGNYVTTEEEATWHYNYMANATDASSAIVWTILTKSEYQASLTTRKNSEYAAIATAAGFIAATESAFLSVLEANYGSTDKTSNITNASLGENVEGWTAVSYNSQRRNQQESVDVIRWNNTAEVWNYIGGAKQTISSLPEGIYKLTVKSVWRIGDGGQAERAGDEANVTAWMYAESNGVTDYTQLKSWYDHQAANNTAVKNSTTDEYVNTLYVYVPEGEDLTIGIASPSWSGVPWMPFCGWTLTYYEAKATPAEKEALTFAIAAAEAKTLGFEDGEYAPYNNVDALSKLAAAKSINLETASGEAVVNATTALTGATWTANAEELNAVYDGNFAIQPEHTTGPTALAGWNNPAGIRQLIKNTETYPGLNTASAKAAVFAWGGTTMKYGETDGYTIPLKGHAIYELSFKTCGWADGDMGHVNVDVKNASDEGLQTVSTVVATKRITEENPWDEFKILFVTGEAGNYKLGMWTSKHTTFTDIVLKKAASQTLTFNDDAAMPAFAPGTYPSVRVNRTLNAGENVWNSLVLPFDYTNAEWAVRELTSSTEDRLSFSVVEGGVMTAGKPYLVRPNEAVTYIEAEHVEVVTTPAAAVETDKYSFIPVFAPTTITGDATNYFVATGTNKLYCAKAEIDTNGYRAYFHYTGTNSSARSVFLNFDEVDPTAINIIEATEAESGALKDGKYIIDNKVVIVKNGVKYSANGQKLN